ncbi:MAG: hypothetical protein IKA02_01160, partial [Clostridia bacterium]|nr:hypothetical protein [Clostridia bacterium]
KREGFGKQTGDWGAYTGFWKDNSYFGPGKEVTKKGETFEGVWTDSDNASFIMYCYDGVLQHGYMKDSQFYEDKEPGIFAKTENYNNGSYHGIIKNGKRNGYGVYTWNSGSRYQGEWVDDVRLGYGRFFWTDGGRYEGMWKNDKMNGMGVYYGANGSYYAGEWKDDNKYRGKQFYSWGTYEGEWANKTWCGYGVEVVNGVATFEGYWKDSKNATNVKKTQNGVTVMGKIVDGTFIAN